MLNEPLGVGLFIGPFSLLHFDILSVLVDIVHYYV